MGLEAPRRKVDLLVELPYGHAPLVVEDQTWSQSLNNCRRPSTGGGGALVDGPRIWANALSIPPDRRPAGRWVSGVPQRRCGRAVSLRRRGFRLGRCPAKARERSLATRWSAPASFHGSPPGRDAGGRRAQDGGRADCDRTCRRGGRWGVNSFEVPRPAGTFGWPPRGPASLRPPNAPEGGTWVPPSEGRPGTVAPRSSKGMGWPGRHRCLDAFTPPHGEGVPSCLAGVTEPGRRPAILPLVEDRRACTQTHRVLGCCCSRPGPLDAGTWRIRAHSAGTENQPYSPF